MIKIVHIISNLGIGGAQILLFDIIKNLNAYKNLDVTVITIDSGEYIKMYEKAGIKVIDLRQNGLLNPGIYYKLKKKIKCLNPDIVHSHLNKADFYGRLAARNSQVPIIFSTCHNYSTTHSGADINRISIFDIIDNKVINYSKSNLIAISELVKKYLVNRCAAFESKTEVIYNGIDITKSTYKLNKAELLKFRTLNLLDKDDFVISIIGRLEKQKGHLFFLQSVKDILHQNNKIKVLIIGNGSLKDKIEEYINENALSEQVILKGFQADSEPYVEISDLICVPSLWEGFGLIIIEGMIKKKIVLASATGGIPEIIKEGINGYLFESENAISLSEKIKYILKHKNNFDAIAENALNMVKERFDIKKNTELYYNSYIRKLNQLNS